MRVSFVSAGFLQLLLIGVCSGQAKEITSQEYLGAYATAINTVLEQPRRRVQKTEYFTNGRKTQTVDEIEEVQDKETRRYVYAETIGSRRTRDETIEVNGYYYCKRNAGAWKKSQEDCSQQMGARVVGGDTDSVEHYSTEQVILNSAPVTLLRHYLTFPASDRNTGRIWENRVWINSNHVIVRREYKSGVPSGTYTNLVETYDYKPRLNIGPPIKTLPRKKK